MAADAEPKPYDARVDRDDSPRLADGRPRVEDEIAVREDPAFAFAFGAGTLGGVVRSVPMPEQQPVAVAEPEETTEPPPDEGDNPDASVPLIPLPPRPEPDDSGDSDDSDSTGGAGG